MARYTYNYVDPSDRPPFNKRVRWTRGAFIEVTGPIGCFGFRYAVFRNRASEILIPVHDLTPETKAAIGLTTTTTNQERDSEAPNIV